MKLRLKEDPREWRKFALSSSLVLAIVAGILCWRQVLPGPILIGALAVLALAASTALVRPGWFRGPYRVGMRVSFGMGRIVGTVVLTLIFVLLVTPLGWLLRLAGKDLLRLRRDPGALTYWQPARGEGRLDRMF